MTRRRTGIRRYVPSIVAGILCLAAVTGILLFPLNGKDSGTVRFSESASVSTICELATLKSYYHNVAMFEEKPEGFNQVLNDVLLWPFGGYTKIGYKQFWLEYSGIVETGIDASQIRMNGPDAKGIVEVYVPDARIINVYADESSLTEPLSENGWFTGISGKEKADAFAKAQSAMREEAENDRALLRRAKENAKMLLEQYIVNTGREIGAEYTVQWLDSPV